MEKYDIGDTVILNNNVIGIIINCEYDDALQEYYYQLRIEEKRCSWTIYESDIIKKIT